MKVIRVLGSEKCYQFEDGEKVAFTDKKRYAEKRVENANKQRPEKHLEKNSMAEKNDSVNEKGSNPTTGKGSEKLGSINGAGRKDTKTNGIKPGIRSKKGSKRKTSSSKHVVFGGNGPGTNVKKRGKV